MKLIAAFFKLIRWPNLVFIVLTQLLFYIFIYQSIFENAAITIFFWMLVTASVFIAAAGYIINDYFDVNIDQVNKPNKIVLNKTLHRRSAIIWHFVLSTLGVLLTVGAVYLSGRWYLAVANAGVVILLWLYSTSLKKQFLIGNIVISALTAWTILVVFFFAYPFIPNNPESEKFFRTAFLYAGFAFIISMIREVIKDAEDREGDRKFGCKTLPIVAGIQTTKIYTAVWITVLISVLIVLQLYIAQFGWMELIIYSILLVILPLVYAFFKLMKANTTADFAHLSNLTKFIMFTGILSMVFFKMYF